jgi:hypothetical protein
LRYCPEEANVRDEGGWVWTAPVRVGGDYPGYLGHKQGGEGGPEALEGSVNILDTGL